MQKKYFILLGIILFALFLRIFQLDSNPPAMHADEADTGYTALSLKKTLHDPYGNFLPLHFQGQANIYRAPLYTYLTVPFVSFFGLSQFTTRIVSVLAGVIFVVLLYIASLKLFGKKDVSLSVAFLAAINPWSILISRTGLEVNLCVVIVTGAITAFLFRGKNSLYIILSSILFGLSLFSYHPAKIAVPLIILVLVIFYYKDLLREKIATIVSVIIFTAFVAIIGFLALFGQGATEFHNASIFQESRANEVVNSQRTLTNAPLNVSPVFSNKITYYVREFVNHFIAPISLNYLYINGEGNLDKGLGNYGLYHLFELPFVILGLIITYKKYRKIFYLLVAWFVIGLIPGGITKNGYYSYRDVILLPVPLLFGGMGLSLLYKTSIKKNLIAFSIAAILSVYLFAYFLYTLFLAYPVYARDWWANNQKKALNYISENKSDHTSVFVQGGMDWAVNYAFYYKMDPVEFQKAYKNQIRIGKNKVIKIENIFIGDIVRNDEKISLTPEFIKGNLIVVPGNYFKEEVPSKYFYGIDGVHIDLKGYSLDE